MADLTTPVLAGAAAAGLTIFGVSTGLDPAVLIAGFAGGLWAQSYSPPAHWLQRLMPDGGRVRLSGAIKSGGSSTITGALSVQIRPTENVRVTCSGYNGAALVPVDLQITTAGVVTIPNYASAPTSIFLNADWPIPAA